MEGKGKTSEKKGRKGRKGIGWERNGGGVDTRKKSGKGGERVDMWSGRRRKGMGRRQWERGRIGDGSEERGAERSKYGGCVKRKEGEGRVGEEREGKTKI